MSNINSSITTNKQIKQSTSDKKPTKRNSPQAKIMLSTIFTISNPENKLKDVFSLFIDYFSSIIKYVNMKWHQISNTRNKKDFKRIPLLKTFPYFYHRITSCTYGCMTYIIINDHHCHLSMLTTCSQELMTSLLLDILIKFPTFSFKHNEY